MVKRGAASGPDVVSVNKRRRGESDKAPVGVDAQNELSSRSLRAWICGACTFKNLGIGSTCSVCETARGLSSPLPAPVAKNTLARTTQSVSKKPPSVKTAEAMAPMVETSKVVLSKAPSPAAAPVRASSPAAAKPKVASPVDKNAEISIVMIPVDINTKSAANLASKPASKPASKSASKPASEPASEQSTKPVAKPAAAKPTSLPDVARSAIAIQVEAASGKPSRTWVCAVCTFKNTGLSRKCNVCLSSH